MGFRKRDESLFQWRSVSVAQRSGPGAVFLNRPKALELAVTRLEKTRGSSGKRPRFQVTLEIFRLS